MGKLKVLMIGPGDPNSQNSGLGVAAHHISKELARFTELTLIQPDNSNVLNESKLMSDLIKINIRATLSPYSYTNTATEVDHQHDDSGIHKELNAFTKRALIKSKKIAFDLIYAHDWSAIPAGLKIKEDTGKPLVVHIHSLDYDRGSRLDRSWVYQLEQESFEKSDAVISVSDYTTNIISNEYGNVDSAKVHSIHNGTERMKYKRRESPFAEKIVVFVGRLTGQKGPGVFIEIAEEVLKQNQNTRFVLAGKGHMMQDLIAKVAAKGMGNKIHFTGHLTKEKLQELYSISHVYCMPSVSEPFGITAIEAANAGIPTVLSKQSGSAEVLTGALTADHWDTKGFARHIVSILKNDKKREKIVRTNKADIKSLTWQNTTEKILSVFNTISG